VTLGDQRLRLRTVPGLLPGAAALLACLSLAVARAPEALPRIRLIATGGTIANQTGGRLSAEALLASAPGIGRIATVEPETFARTPSLALSLDDWLRLAHRINDAVADADLAGVVVTAGTDTLEELAWFLDLTVGDESPVVVTGAIRKPGTPDADGPDNLTRAAQVAVDPASRGRGTVVVFHGTIFSAREAEKASTTSLDAFRSRTAAPIGQVDASGVRFGVPPRGRNGGGPSFDVRQVTTLPRVDVILTYQGAPGDLIEAAAASGARGLVIAAAGAGALPEPEADAVARVLRRGIPVVIASRVPGGRVSADDLGAIPGLLAAGDLAPIKARVLLMLGLSRGLNGRDLARVFEAS
jgi:L-asparaginase